MSAQSPLTRGAKKERENYTVCSKSPSQEVTPLGFKLESAEILNPCSQPHFILPPERGPTTAHCGGEGPPPQPCLWRSWRTPWESNSGPGPGVTGRPHCPGAVQGAGARPDGHAEPEKSCPAPWAPCLLHLGVQLRPARRFPGHATFSIAE